jgi:hypothetical protein
MRPPTPGSPGSVKSAKNNNGSILERALGKIDIEETKELLIILCF